MSGGTNYTLCTDPYMLRKERWSQLYTSMDVFLAVMVDVNEEIDIVFGKHHRDDKLQIMIVLTQSAVSLSSTLRRPSPMSRNSSG